MAGREIMSEMGSGTREGDEREYVHFGRHDGRVVDTWRKESQAKYRIDVVVVRRG